MSSYDSWKQDSGRDTWEPRETRDSSCIKCGTEMEVPFDFVGQPWCDRCVEKDKQFAKHYTSKARTA